MCNLYSMTATVDEMRRAFGPFDGDRDNLPPFDNIFPNYKAAGGRPVTNVRNLTSPFWRSALKDPARRCLVPVTKFCEWTAEPHAETKRKSKVWFGHNEQPVFAFAGIWRPGEGGPFMSFLTCEPNALVGAVHPKAMPVMLDPADHARWLDNDHEDVCSLAVPYSDARMISVA
jgi:putative SOS response-associated peptidase YedK